jgi:hypothetical protein
VNPSNLSVLVTQCSLLLSTGVPCCRRTPFVRPLSSDVCVCVWVACSGTAGGKLRHRVDLLLPVNEKEFDFLATEPIDYPCSLQKEFDTACSLAKLLLQASRRGVHTRLGGCTQGMGWSASCIRVPARAIE